MQIRGRYERLRRLFEIDAMREARKQSLVVGSDSVNAFIARKAWQAGLFRQLQ